MSGQIGDTPLPIECTETNFLKRLFLSQSFSREEEFTTTGERISIPAKEMGSGIRYAAGGLIFGLEWALTGACPGPLFALIGAGVSVSVVTAASALVGTWIYGWLRPRLPH